jgi:hypothetical protein
LQIVERDLVVALTLPYGAIRLARYAMEIWVLAFTAATGHACWRGSGRIYHVHHKGFSSAIGEPDNRHRRPTTLARAVERLMVGCRVGRATCVSSCILWPPLRRRVTICT